MKRRHAATLKLVKPIFDGCHRRRRVSVRSIQLFFDSAARFPFQKQESYIILPFLLTFCVCFHTRSKQNYDSNLTVILTVALRLILHDGKFFLSQWWHPAVRLNNFIPNRNSWITIQSIFVAVDLTYKCRSKAHSWYFFNYYYNLNRMDIKKLCTIQMYFYLFIKSMNRA